MKGKLKKDAKSVIVVDKENNSVDKAFSPEEQAILGNIQSLIQELVAPNVTMEETITEEEPVVMAKGEQEEEDKEVEKVLVQNESDGATASDDAEERIEETQIPESEENVKEVAKALIQALTPKKKVEKSSIEIIAEAIQSIAKVQKSTDQQVQDLHSAFGHLLEGIGIAEQMGVAKSAQPEAIGQPIVSNENEQFLNFAKEISNLVNKSKEEEVDERHMSQNQHIRKNLSDPNVLRALIANKG